MVHRRLRYDRGDWRQMRLETEKTLVGTEETWDKGDWRQRRLGTEGMVTEET